MKNQPSPKLIERVLNHINKGKKQSRFILHISSDIVPSTKKSIFKFNSALTSNPNILKEEVVFHESGKIIERLEVLSKKEGVSFFKVQELKISKNELKRSRIIGAPITITPNENVLTLREGESFEEILRVNIPSNSSVSKIDVYFLADTTGSMAPVLEQVQASINSIISAVSGGAGIDIAFGVGNYKDFPNPFSHQVSPSNDLEAVRLAIRAWRASDGGDLPEAQLFALDQLAEDTNSIINWRFDSKKIIVWLGDAPGHDPVCRAISGLPYDINIGSLIGKLARQDITVIAISTTTGSGLDADPFSISHDYETECGSPAISPNQATNLVNATGGSILLDVEPRAIANAIIDSINTSTSTIAEVRLDPENTISPFIASISPRRRGPISGDVNQELDFTVLFDGTVPCSDEDQVFEGNIAVLVDGNVADSKHVRITVPRCKQYAELTFSPSAVVSRRDLTNTNRRNQINIFARGKNGSILLCRNSGGDPTDPNSWRWDDRGRPQGALADGTPFATASDQAVGARFNNDDFIHSFIKGSNGHLYETYWNGYQWTGWIDRGQPTNWNNLIFSPSVALFNPSNGLTQTADFLYSYVIGEDGNMHSLSPSTGFGWRSQGKLYDNLISSPGIYSDGGRWVSIFVVAINANTTNLVVRHLRYPFPDNESYWSWFDLGKPTNPQVRLLWLRRPATVNFFHDGINRYYTFLPTSDGHLWIHRWSNIPFRDPVGDLGEWSDQGVPQQNVRVTSSVGVVVYNHGGYDQIYAFIRGNNGSLYCHIWETQNGRWVWKNLTRPIGVTLKGDPSVVIFERQNTDPIYVFMRGNDDHLYMCHLNSSVTQWDWKDISEIRN